MRGQPQTGIPKPWRVSDAEMRAALTAESWPRSIVFRDASFPFAIYDVPGHPSLGMHTHEGFVELVIVYGGRGTHLTAHGQYLIAPGDAFVIAGDMQHGYADVEALLVVEVLYDAAYLFRGLSEVRRLPGYHALFELEPRYRGQHAFESRLRLTPDRLAQLLDLLREIVRVMAGRADGYQLHTKVAFMQVICFLCERYLDCRHPSHRCLILLDDVIRFLESNYAEPIRVPELAERIGMSERSLQLLFKEAIGLSPIDYLIRVRVAKASELLRSTRLSITDIAFECGFQDSNYLSRQFRRITGMQPREYRSRFTPAPVL